MTSTQGAILTKTAHLLALEAQEKLGALLEALGLGNVCCSQATGISQVGMSPVPYQGTDALQAPRAGRLVNGSFPLTVRFVNVGPSLNQPDQTLRMSSKSSNVGWGLGIAGGRDIQGGACSYQLD